MRDTIQLGKRNTLEVTKRVDFGYYLDGGEMNGEILLPNGEVAEDASITPGDKLSCFIYLDNEERMVATMHRPFAEVGDFAFLEVAWVNNFGAFLNWGLIKDLFVPFREQKMKMQIGKSYIVYVHLDEESYRIVASAKVEKFLAQDIPPYRHGDEVELLVWQKTDLGLKAIVDNRYGGLLYDTQVFRNLRTGDRVRGYVRQVRPDGKIDLMLQREGMDAVADFSDTLLRRLRAGGGFSHLGDKSPADDIYSAFGVSKKVFKKAVGDLYRRHLIEIVPEGIKLVR